MPTAIGELLKAKFTIGQRLQESGLGHVSKKNQINHIWDKTDDMEDRINKQCKYSAVFNKWDIYTKFNKLEILSKPEDDPHPQSNLNSSSHSASTNPSTNHAHPPLPPPPTLNPNHNAQGIVLAHMSGIDNEQVDVPQVDILLCHHYGFILEVLAAAIREESVSPVDDLLSLDNAVSSTSCQDAACQAVTLIKRDLLIPDLYWDLKNDKLHAHNLCYFMFLLLELNSVDSDTTFKGYIVNPTSSRYLRYLALYQCIHAGKEKKMVQLLLEVPRLRGGVVLRGGKLTCICSPYVNLDDVAAYGPSNGAICYGSRWKGEDENIIFTEDYVSDAEIELLCSHFHIDTSAESSQAGQSRTVSFFPMPNIWESSGIHMLSWSNSAKEKFHILMGKLRPSVDPASPVLSPVPVKGKKEWRQNLHHHICETKGFLGYMEQASSEFLTSLLLASMFTKGGNAIAPMVDWDYNLEHHVIKVGFLPNIKPGFGLIIHNIAIKHSDGAGTIQGYLSGVDCLIHVLDISGHHFQMLSRNQENWLSGIVPSGLKMMSSKDEEGDKLFVSLSGQEYMLLQGLDPADFLHDQAAFNRFLTQVDPILGNLRDIHQSWSRNENKTIQILFMTFTFENWSTSVGNEKGYSLLGYSPT
ncbi:hypothetical protein EV363DRAFT_1295575 [Boletus edulis]|nr:hypothetical protein EV363DRAFT_1295575 [Boletus edulis]